MTKALELQVIKRLREYRKRYLKEEFADSDESATRLMVNYFLCQVLGYRELVDVKTEYCIKGTYADYVIQIDRKKYFVVEVKAIETDLNKNHVRQSIGYAVDEGIDWVILTNGRQIQLYRVTFTKPIKRELFFDFDLSDLKTINSAGKMIAYISKKSILKDELNILYDRQSAISTKKLSNMILKEPFLRTLRREMKKTNKISYSHEELKVALIQVIEHSPTNDN